MLTQRHEDIPPGGQAPLVPTRRPGLRLVLGGLALALFSFWLGARLGPLTVFGSGNGLTQGTWLPTPVPAEAYIGGAVVHPGLYPIGPHARLAALLREAGGPTRNADLGHVPLAAPIHDGQTITVPRHNGKGCPGTRAHA
jgi:hypothetical protein